MTYDQAISYFGSPSAMARALRVKAPSVMEWKSGIPELRQYQIELASHGLLKADLPACELSTSAEVRADHPELIRDLVAKVAQSEQAAQTSGPLLPSSTAAGE